MSDLDDICAGLEAKAGHLRQVLERTDEAVIALRNLQLALGGEEPAPVRAALAAPPAAVLPPRERASKPESRATPAPANCAYDACRAPLQPRSTPGRPKRFCDRACATKARDGRAASPAADPTDELLQRQDPIPESGAGMKARVAARKPGPTFLDRARERNDEAARRNGVSRRSA